MNSDVSTNTRYDSEAEQISEEIIKVESSEQTVDDSPSAIYDAETGQLDIIHHHNSENSTESESLNSSGTETSPPNDSTETTLSNSSIDQDELDFPDNDHSQTELSLDENDYLDHTAPSVMSKAANPAPASTSTSAPTTTQQPVITEPHQELI